MDVASVVLACSLFGNDALIEGIIRAESAAAPMHVRAHDSVVGFPFESPAEALVAIRSIRDDERAVHVGWMGINPEDARDFNVRPDQLFDPCMSVAIGSELLSRYAVACGATPAQPQVGCALRKYATMLGREPDLFATNVMFERRADEVEPLGRDAPGERASVLYDLKHGESTGAIFFAPSSGE